MSDRFAEPTECLWIGFPASVQVDELILRKAFSSFEVEKVTTFPLRNFAFVRLKNVMEACRAKEALQGKLLDNPRILISFGKSPSGTSKSKRNWMNAPPSPHFRSYRFQGCSVNFRQGRNIGILSGDLSLRYPKFISNMESSDPDFISFNRKGDLRVKGKGAFEQRRVEALSSEVGLPSHIYEHRTSPTRNRSAHLSNFSTQKFPRQGPFYDDSLDLPEDSLLFHGRKKPKTIPSPVREFPEYPLSDSRQVKHILRRIHPDFPQPEALDKKYDSGFCYKQIYDRAIHIIQPYGERSNSWNASHCGFLEGSVPLPSCSTEWERLTPESHQSSLSEGWKWEGTIAKGGVPLFRAHCFPVGIPLDINLPEFLNCTEKTTLDIFEQHYYQATSAWVVFFVAAGHTDIEDYNDLMEYLIELQRVGIAKLDARTTLFLIPPSEFSNDVLKVERKQRIFGVALRLEHPDSDFGSLHRSLDEKDANFEASNGDTSYSKPALPPIPYSSSVPNFPNVEKPMFNNTSVHGALSTVASPVSITGYAPATENISKSRNEHRPEYFLYPRKPSVAPLESPVSVSGGPSNGVSVSENKPPISSPFPNVPFQTEHFAQLTSLIGKQRQSTGVSMEKDFRQSSPSSFDLVKPVQQQQQLPEIREVDADRAKRLQVTLELASAIVRLMQKGKGT